MVHDNKIRPGIQKIERLRDVLRFAATPKHQPESCQTRNVIGFWCVRPLFYVVAPLVGKREDLQTSREPLRRLSNACFRTVATLRAVRKPAGILAKKFHYC